MLLLNNFFKGIFFPLFLFASYYPIYNKSNPDFLYSFENGNYKVIVKNQSRINYYKYNGFKFFIPNFTRNFSLQVLRFNSIGYINGYLALSPAILPNQIISKNPTQLKYYYTDYKYGYNQLDYLLANRAVYYPNVTSLSIEAYNIPLNKPLNRTFYFTFVHTKQQNKLKYLVYSFSMELDKLKVDNYVKKYLKLKKYKDSEFDYIYTYMNNLNKKIAPKKIYIPKSKPHKTIVKKKIKKPKKLPYHLDTKRLFYMIDYPLPIQKAPTINIPKNNFSNDDISDINNTIYTTKETMLELKKYLDKQLNTKVLLFPKDVLKVVNNYYYSLTQLDTILPKLKKALPKKQKVTIDKCFFDYSNINKDCYKNKDYFYKYVYYLSFDNKIPSKEAIEVFGDYRVYNKIGEFYFKNGDFENAKKYLFKSYALSPNNKKNIIAHNLATLFYNESGKFKKPDRVIKYLKQSNLPVDYFNLGVYYYIGFGVKESDKMAYKLFKKSANQGFIKAKNNIKIMEKYKIGLK